MYHPTPLSGLGGVSARRKRGRERGRLRWHDMLRGAVSVFRVVGTWVWCGFHASRRWWGHGGQDLLGVKGGASYSSPAGDAETRLLCDEAWLSSRYRGVLRLSIVRTSILDMKPVNWYKEQREKKNTKQPRDENGGYQHRFMQVRCDRTEQRYRAGNANAETETSAKSARDKRRSEDFPGQCESIYASDRVCREQVSRAPNGAGNEKVRRPRRLSKHGGLRRYGHTPQ